MKMHLSILLCVFGTVGSSLKADPLESKVIHNYDYVGVGYRTDYANGSGFFGHGVVGELSFEEHNVVLTVTPRHTWGEDFGIRHWAIDSRMGYVVRLMENRLNIIPRLGGFFGEVSFDLPGTTRRSVFNEWLLTAGGTVSYAVMDRLALSGSYTYVMDTEFRKELHDFVPALRLAVLERVGVTLAAQFVEYNGFTSLTGAVEFHF